MANQFQSISSGIGELKNFYQGPMIDDLNETIVMHKFCESKKDGWSGYQVNRPLRVQRNQGIGATSDGGNLPKIGRQGTIQATFQSAFNYLRFGVTGPMIKASVSDVGSFVRSASYELEMGYKDLKNDINRQLGWNGDGTLATVNAAVAGSNVMVIAGRESTAPALQFVDVNLSFDIYTSAGAVVQQGITVNSISSGNPNSATATLVLDQNVNCSATDVLVRAGSFGYEIKGLFYTLDGGTSTIYGVDRATYMAYQGNVTSLASGQLTLNAMQGSWNQGLRRGNVSKYDAIVTDYTTQQYYQKLLTPDKRYVNVIAADGGFGPKGGAKDKSFLEFNGAPLMIDKDFPTRLAFLPGEVLKNYILAELEFADETGSMMIAQTGSDSFEVRVRYFTQLFNEQPAACAVLTNYISP
jgi:hypothetical protein